MDKISQFASATPYMPTRLKLAETKVFYPFQLAETKVKISTQNAERV
jgi:hypothetical protein